MIQEDTARLRQLERMLDSLPLGVQLCDTRGVVTYANAACCRMHGYRPGEMVGASIVDRPPTPAERDELKSYLAYLVEQQPPPTPYFGTTLTRDGRLIKVEVNWDYLRDELGALVGFSSQIRELTQAPTAREAFESLERGSEAQRLLQTLLDNVPGMVYRCKNDADWTLIFANEGCKALTGHPPEQLVRKEVDYAALIHPGDRERVWSMVQAGVEANTPYEVTYRIHSLDGQLKWVWERGQGVRAPDGTLLGLEGFITDISSYKRAEETAHATVAEKEVLLKEIHHRVKNNLQVIASLLFMQSRRPEARLAGTIFEETRNRIQTMALLHEHLYQSDNMANVEMGPYLRRLCSDLAGAYEAEEVRVQTEIAPLTMSLDQAIPCGLVVNELLSNAFKHARSRSIELRLTPVPAGQLRLEVADDGVGLPAGAEAPPFAGLGLQLVDTLIGQLEGRWEVIRDGGTRFVVHLPA